MTEVNSSGADVPMAMNVAPAMSDGKLSAAEKGENKHYKRFELQTSDVRPLGLWIALWKDRTENEATNNTICTEFSLIGQSLRP